LARELDGSIRNRNGGAANGCLTAHALGDGERLLHDGIKKPAGGVHLLRLLPSLLHLENNLGLADDHRVKAGCDAEDMAEGGFIQQAVEVLTLAELESIIGAE